MIAIIAALDPQRVIGSKGKLPWHIPEDLKHFKEKTLHNTIVMGRKTFESIGRPLPKRNNIVVSTTLEPHEGIEVARSYEEALQKAQQYDSQVFIIGGRRLYERALKDADRMFLTHVHKEYGGDTHFPEYDPCEWRRIDCRRSKACTFATYAR